MAASKSNYYSKIRPALKNKNVRTYSYIVFSVITVVILVVFAVRPTLKTIIELQKNIDDQKAKYAQLQQKYNNIEKGIENYNKIEPDTKIKLLTLLPSTTSLSCLVNNLYSQALSAGVIIIGVQVQQADLFGNTKCLLTNEDLAEYKRTAKAAGEVKELKFTFNTVGSFDALLNLLQSFNTSNRLMSIEQVNYSKPEDGPLMMSITAKGYYYK